MRKLGLLALVALLSLISVSAASAKAKPKVEAFAAKHHLTGSWKGKDADRDGLKNLKEFKKVTATLDTECTPALVEDEEATCDDDVLEQGVVLQSAELEAGYLTAYLLA